MQPLGWWLANHVAEGKEELNFSEFTNLPPEGRAHKLAEIIEQVEHSEMPLRSYTLLHREANLTQAEKEILINRARPGAEKIHRKQRRQAHFRLICAFCISGNFRKCRRRK